MRPPARRIIRGTLRAPFERLLVAVDHRLRQAELAAALDAGMFEMQRRHDRRIAREQHVERLVVHERAMFERVVAGSQRVLDPFGRPAMAGHFQAVVVRLGTTACISSNVMHSVW